MKKSILILTLTIFSLQIFAQKEITVSDIWQYYKFFPSDVEGLKSMNDGKHYSVYETASISKYAYKTGEKVEDLVKFLDISTNRFSSEYEFSADETKIILYTNQERIYRHSFVADYYVYDLETKKSMKVSENGKQQLATFSPNGESVAFVRENNLYIKSLETKKEQQITTDGKYNHILNGIPDWVYEEEFGFNKAFEWSPDGKFLAYIKFDESNVKMFNMTKFAGKYPHIKANELYPENYTFKYPKAGDDNSVVSVHIYNVETGKTVKVDIGTETDIYIPRIRWTQSSENLSVFRLNRLQNKLEIMYANSETGKTKTIITEKNKYYIEDFTYDKIFFLEDGEHIVMPSERDGYRHLYLYKTDGTLVKQLTKGEWDITDFYGYDEKKKLFYFQAAAVSPLEREVYSIDFEGEKMEKISTKKGTNSADFSKGFEYYVLSFSDVNTPPYVTLHNKKGKLIRVLEDNENLKKRVEEYGGQHKEFFKFKTSEGVELNACKIVAPDFDETKKHAVIVMQYSGPGSQKVTNAWEYDSFGWVNLLAQKGFVVIMVDPRGTGARGQEFKKITYKQLGKYETIDLIETAKYLGTLPYVDRDRIGIWGWSYGGYMASLCMTKGADYYNTGIAVAPVTTWRYYDNIYTERFMTKPQDNSNGYDDNSPINHAEKLKGNLMLIHGTADDNVHLQNTMEFAEALVQAGKQFDMMIYNNRNHSIYGGNTRYHLFTLKTNYFIEHLKPEILK